MLSHKPRLQQTHAHSRLQRGPTLKPPLLGAQLSARACWRHPVHPAPPQPCLQS